MLTETAILRPVCSIILLVLYVNLGALTVQAKVNQYLVHILMVLGNIQMRALKTVVGKVSM